MAELDKEVALITGGARGIGKNMAVAFAKEGADIVLGDVIEMKDVAQEIRDLGRKVITVKVDVSKKEQVDNLIVTAINIFGKLDILVNSAGIARHARFLDMSEEDWDVVLNVNLKGVFLCSQAAAKYMIERKYGKIINVASISGMSSIAAGQANYGAAKAGVIQLTRICARELGCYGINVNAIAPGLVVTNITYSRRTQSEVESTVEDWKKSSALGRVGTTQDMANLALFLASDKSSFITGQVIVSDGGRI